MKKCQELEVWEEEVEISEEKEEEPGMLEEWNSQEMPHQVNLKVELVEVEEVIEMVEIDMKETNEEKEEKWEDTTTTITILDPEVEVANWCHHPDTTMVLHIEAHLKEMVATTLTKNTMTHMTTMDQELTCIMIDHHATEVHHPQVTEEEECLLMDLPLSMTWWEKDILTDHQRMTDLKEMNTEAAVVVHQEKEETIKETDLMTKDLHLMSTETQEEHLEVEEEEEVEAEVLPHLEIDPDKTMKTIVVKQKWEPDKEEEVLKTIEAPQSSYLSIDERN